MFIRACFQRKAMFVCLAGWIPEKQLLAQGRPGGREWGVLSMPRRLSFGFSSSLNMSVSHSFLVHGTMPHMISL